MKSYFFSLVFCVWLWLQTGMGTNVFQNNIGKNKLNDQFLNKERKQTGKCTYLYSQKQLITLQRRRIEFQFSQKSNSAFAKVLK